MSDTLKWIQLFRIDLDFSKLIEHSNDTGKNSGASTIKKYVVLTFGENHPSVQQQIQIRLNCCSSFKVFHLLLSSLYSGFCRRSLDKKMK